ncbi:hypothetical protein ACE1ET_09120 [Saccharicrinis sp. FJH62]|uniref:hypothetical protein n=1 Tax=Saccharicrinis sp. FJH62 TaxID=3344657 RepID=UPI0035D4F289
MSKKNISVKILLAFLIIIPTFLVVSVLFQNNYTKDVFKEYPLINSTQPVNKVIIKSGRYRGTTLLEDEDGKSFSIRAWSFSKGPGNLSFYIDPGDSIALERGNDTLYLYKKTGGVIPFEVQYPE